MIRVGEVEVRINGLPSPDYLARVVQGLGA